MTPDIGRLIVDATACEHECFPCSICGPKGHGTVGVLDVTVRTDTKVGVGRGSKGCILWPCPRCKGDVFNCSCGFW